MKRNLNIIGAGKVGRVLGRQFHQHQVFTVQDVLSRTSASAEAACQFIGAGRPVQDIGALRAADIVMVSVPDDQIQSCGHALRLLDWVGPDAIVFHCSGALGSDVLGLQQGAASVHPVRSFADPGAVDQQFAGTICTLEGDTHATQILDQALQAIAARVVPIRRDNKTLYHAGAVFAANYLVTLLDAALQTMQAAGINAEMAAAMLQPLAQGALENTFRLGAKQALTGPIARGDLQTVARHEAALQNWDQDKAALYRAMGKATRDMLDQ